MATTIDTAALDSLAASLSGAVLRPADGDYDAVRQVHNGLIDKRPAVIVRCRGVADVVDAVRFGVDQGLDISVRGGGHNVAGNAVCDDGLMIDLAGMKGLHVDSAARTARAQAGLTWGEFNRETQIHGLATTGGVISSTGVAGLTLGGGLGWLMGKYGMTCDNLLSAELVTAAGEVVTASADENPDLFWALRGGGGNFGVVTSFEFQLHAVGPMVTGGLVAYPIEQAKRVLSFYRERTAALPEELTLFAGLIHAPDGSGNKLVAILACHCGPLEEGEKALAPIKAFGEPAMVELGPIPYTAINAMLDDGFPKGALNYWKSNFLSSLDDAAMDVLIEQFSSCPSPMTGLVLEHFHGAATQVSAADTAFPHRADGYNVLFASEWMSPEDTATNISWTRETYAAMEPFMSSGSYVNYLGDDESETRVRAAFGENFPRLQQVKTQFDPGNVFRLNQNIPPA